MVYQMGQLVYSFGLNDSLRICLTPRKSCVKIYDTTNRGTVQCPCKMAGTGIHSLAKLRGQMPQFTTTGITPWQTVLKFTADCQAPRSGGKECMRPGQACDNPKSINIKSFQRVLMTTFTAFRSHIWRRDCTYPVIGSLVWWCCHQLTTSIAADIVTKA
jgi:hypothetical protein